MNVWAWIGAAAAGFVIAGLLIKIHLLRKSAEEIRQGFAYRLENETNTLIDISSRDRCMKRLATDINSQLLLLCKERQRFQQGDKELKEAVTNIAHDLRTPLTAICGYLDLLEGEDKSDEAARYIDIIANRAEILKQLTQELFRYSVIVSAGDEGAPERVVLNSVLEESLAAYYAALTERGIEPVINMPEEKLVRWVNREALTRVFGNILDNVLKYSDGDLEIEMTAKGEICFTNTASGLDNVQVGRLFEQFYTVEAARSSTGLGLSIARALVTRMKGTIGARYNDGRLTICVELPE